MSTSYGFKCYDCAVEIWIETLSKEDGLKILKISPWLSVLWETRLKLQRDGDVTVDFHAEDFLRWYTEKGELNRICEFFHMHGTHRVGLMNEYGDHWLK